jgi:hypothetical protein
MLADPAVGSSSVMSILMVVVLPAPLGPSNPKSSPASMANDTPDRLDLLAVAPKHPGGGREGPAQVPRLEDAHPGTLAAARTKRRCPAMSVSPVCVNPARSSARRLAIVVCRVRLDRHGPRQWRQGQQPQGVGDQALTPRRLDHSVADLTRLAGSLGSGGP